MWLQDQTTIESNRDGVEQIHATCICRLNHNICIYVDVEVHLYIHIYKTHMQHIYIYIHAHMTEIVSNKNGDITIMDGWLVGWKIQSGL